MQGWFLLISFLKNSFAINYNIFKYQFIITFPHKDVIKNPNTINGPNGIGSFRVLIFAANKTIEIIAPKTNDKNIFNNIFLNPKTKPKAPIRVTSPPPMPPRDINTMAVNNPPATSNPKKLLINSKDISYKK